MGFATIKEKWDHVDDGEALQYFQRFYDYALKTRALWRRYVHSEHIKFIVEQPIPDYFFGRSIFRSVQQYAHFEQLDVAIFEKNWFAFRNGYTGEFEIVSKSPPMNRREFRSMYRMMGGTGNW